MKKTSNLDSVKANKSSINTLLFGLAAVTLYFNEKANDPFNTYKLIIALFLSGWLSGQIVGYYRKNPLKKNATDFYLLVLISLFLISQVLSLAFSDIFIVSFLGETQRRNGLLSYFALSIIIIYTSIKFNYHNSIQFLKSSVLVGLVLVIYGTLQIFGRDFVDWNNPHNSMIGTVGNPNFASSLIAILILLALYTLFNKSIHLGYRLASLTVIFLGFFSIYRSNSRQGLLVVGLGLLLFASLYSWFQNKRFKFLVPAASLLVILVSVLGMLQRGPAAYFLYKDSVSVRGFYWGAAIEMFKSFPLTGVGLDSYGSYFKEYRSPSYPLRYGYELTSTNAHNTFLQLFSTGGVLVGVSYCLLMLLILLLGLKNIKETSGVERSLAITLLSIWVSFQAQSFISIDNMGISIWGWVLGGAIIGLRNNRLKGVEDSKRKVGPKSIDLPQVLISTLFLLPILIISILLHRQEADLFVAKSAIMQRPINQELVLLNAKKVLDNNLADPFYEFEAALIYFELGRTQVGEAKVKELSENDPRNLIFLDWLARNEIRKTDYAAALNLALQIEKYDPWNVKNIFLIGELHKLLGNFAEMEKIRLKVNAMAPNTELSIKANQILV